jgi:hypothetical protein
MALMSTSTSIREPLVIPGSELTRLYKSITDSGAESGSQLERQSAQIRSKQCANTAFIYELTVLNQETAGKAFLEGYLRLIAEHTPWLCQGWRE